jgi:ribosomal protein L22
MADKPDNVDEGQDKGQAEAGAAKGKATASKPAAKTESKPAAKKADDKPVKKATAKQPKAGGKQADAEAVDAKAPKAGGKKAAAAKPKAAGKQADAKADAEKPAAKGKAPKAGGAQPVASKPKSKAAATVVDPDEIVEVRATAKYVRSSARKARLVVDHIRGRRIEEARTLLDFTPRHVARDVAKVLNSAVANAEHNHELDSDDLVIAAAFVDEGPTLKRWQPRARGRATPIMKRTSHITVVVSNGPANKSSRKAAA